MFRFAIEDLKTWSKYPRPKPLVIRGARQVGKSTLVKIFCQEEGLELIEVNLEKNKLRELDNETTFSIGKVLSEIELITGKAIGAKSLLFLDEVQEQSLAFNRLRYFYEDAPGVRVIAAGSLLDVILDEASFSMPVGRIEYYYLGPMTFREFLIAKSEGIVLKQLASLSMTSAPSQALHERLIEILKEYYFVGGMPEAVKTYIETKDMKQVRRVQNDLLQTYRDDIPKYTKGKQGLRVKEVFDYVPANLGNAKVKFSDISATNSLHIKEAIEVLHKAQVIIKVLHSTSSGLPLAAGGDPSIMKLFFLDVGLYNAVMDVQWQNLFLADEEELLTKGNIAEQFIAQHLNQRNPRQRNELFYWLRDGKSGAAEIDFVISLNGRILPIEVKAGSTGKMRSLWQFLAEKNMNYAVKFDLKLRDKFLSSVSQKVPAGNEVREVHCDLLALPLYSVELLADLIL
jgi:uncharacterized protein